MSSKERPVSTAAAWTAAPRATSLVGVGDEHGPTGEVGDDLAVGGAAGRRRR